MTVHVRHVVRSAHASDGDLARGGSAHFVPCGPSVSFVLTAQERAVLLAGCVSEVAAPTDRGVLHPTPCDPQRACDPRISI